MSPAEYFRLAFSLQGFAELVILFFLFYGALLFIRGSRALQLLKGIGIVAIAFVLADRLGLNAINWVLTKIIPVGIIAFFILFQPEIRRALARLGRRPFPSASRREDIVQMLMEACATLSKKRIGALIAIERGISLDPYARTGVRLDSQASAELIVSVFLPPSPLHDGGMVLQGDRIAAASCLLPLSQRSDLYKLRGTRHRAAIGLSEETDALVLVVSEETGEISLAGQGRLSRSLDGPALRKVLGNIYHRPARRTGRWKGFLGLERSGEGS
jgi:diadenylate cyclase